MEKANLYKKKDAHKGRLILRWPKVASHFSYTFSTSSKMILLTNGGLA